MNTPKKNVQMTSKDQGFVNKFNVSFVSSWRRVTFKFWEMLTNASEVNLVAKIFFFPKNFELRAKFCGMQSKPG
jgi:hypothetical protein